MWWRPFTLLSLFCSSLTFEQSLCYRSCVESLCPSVSKDLQWRVRETWFTWQHFSCPTYTCGVTLARVLRRDIHHRHPFINKHWVIPHHLYFAGSESKYWPLIPVWIPGEQQWVLRGVSEWKYIFCAFAFLSCWLCEPLDLCEYRQGSLPVLPRWSRPSLEAGGELKCTTTHTPHRFLTGLRCSSQIMWGMGG